MSQVAASKQTETVKTTCPYCGVGCGVDASVAASNTMDANVIAVSGDQQHRANLGRLCVKGSALQETTGAEGRLLYPKIQGQQVAWDTAIRHVADGFKSVIAEHGPDAVAFYVSGQLLTEDYYVANKLMKGFIGSANIDTNSRLCMSSAVAGYKRAFGEDVVPCSYEDLETCDLLVMVGSNAAWTHPVLYQRIAAAREARPDMRVVVIDPRRTATCDLADLHLRVAPGSDAFLFAGLLNYLKQHEKINHQYIAAHTEGFEAALDVVSGYNLECVAEVSGVDVADLDLFYRWFAATEKTVSFYSQGINQSSSGTDKCNAIINCHLATGRIGREGMGPFSITGQPNAMGGREVGGLANQLAAHMDFDPVDVDRVKRFWQAPNMATKPGLKAVDLFDAIERGQVKAVWIMATNPVVSMPDADRVRRALQSCDLVVVSDCVEHTDTAACATVLLPATGWGEKDGTVTNSERCISRQRPLHTPLGDARHDWWILSRVAEAMGFTDAFAYRDAQQIFAEHARLSGFENSRERIFNISKLSNISKVNYNSMLPVKWPVTDEYPNGCERLFADGVFSTASGKANFVAVTPSLPVQRAESHSPFTLNTGRVRDQWHTMTRTAKSPRLQTHIAAPFVAMNPADAKRLGISAGVLAEVHNERGALHLEATIDESVRVGELFIPMHWNDQYASKARVGSLVAPVTDPVSGQPESKFVPADVRALPVSLWLEVISREPVPVDGLDYWVRAKIPEGYRYRAGVFSSSGLIVAEWLQSWCPEGELLEYRDSGNGDYRAMIVRDQAVEAMVFASSQCTTLPEPSWLTDRLSGNEVDNPWLLLAGKSALGQDKGRMICSCFEVGENQIASAIAAGVQTVKSLGESLCCGTNCGSCIPELKVMINDLTENSTQSDAA